MRKPTASQRASVKSWTLLEPRPEILIFADEGDEDTAALAKEYGCRLTIITERHHRWGNPYINIIFEASRRMASGDYLLFVNADIILSQEVIDAVLAVEASLSDDQTNTKYPEFFTKRKEVDYVWEWRTRQREERLGRVRNTRPSRPSTSFSSPAVIAAATSSSSSSEAASLAARVASPPADFSLPAFVMCGRRWGLNQNERNVTDDEWLDMIGSDPEWLTCFKDFVIDRGGRFVIGASMDYFLFPRYLRLPMPPYMVGLPRWDSWMLDYSIKNGIPFVDASHVAFALHQDHPGTWDWEKPGAQHTVGLRDVDMWDLKATEWRLRPCNETANETCTRPIKLMFEKREEEPQEPPIEQAEPTQPTPIPTPTPTPSPPPPPPAQPGYSWLYHWTAAISLSGMLGLVAWRYLRAIKRALRHFIPRTSFPSSAAPPASGHHGLKSRPT